MGMTDELDRKSLQKAADLLGAAQGNVDYVRAMFAAEGSCASREVVVEALADSLGQLAGAVRELQQVEDWTLAEKFCWDDSDVPF